MVNRIGGYQQFFRLIDAYFLRLPIFLFIKPVFTVRGDNNNNLSQCLKYQEIVYEKVFCVSRFCNVHLSSY